MNRLRLMLFLFFFLVLFSGGYGDDSETCSASRGRRRSEEYEELSETWKLYLRSYDEAEAGKGEGDDDEEDVYGSVIDSDLAPFRRGGGGIGPDLLDRCRMVDDHAVTYQAVGGKLYRSPADCLFPARCQGVEHFLLAVLPSVPDFELVLNTHDWPQVRKRLHADRPLPTFSFSKTDEYFDVFFPAWTFWAGGPAISHHPTGLGRWDLMRERMLAAKQRGGWEEKEDAAFFRGSRTSAERDPLILLSRSRPKEVDAKYTKNQAWRSAEDTLGEPPAREVRLEDHCEFRYLFNYRGVAASFRYKHLFLCGSTVIQVGSRWKEFFYDALLSPWRHYVPVEEGRNTVEGLADILAFLRHFPEVSRAIAANGERRIRKRLTMGDVEEYWRRLLASYAELLTFRPELKPGFVQIV